MIIKVLCENTVGYDGAKICTSEWGLSLYIESNNLKLLLDTGQSDIYLKNAKALNINLEEVDVITLSHHHYDHVDGLKYFPDRDKKKLVVHNSLLQKLDEDYSKLIKRNFIVNESDVIYRIHQNIHFLGTIPRATSFEKGYHKSNDTIDDMKDDSALVFNTEEGLIIVSGCSHSGICNICEYAKEQFNKRIRGVIGGFHLFIDNTVAIQGTIDYFKKESPDFLYPMHCLDFETLISLEKELGIRKFSTGDTIIISE